MKTLTFREDFAIEFGVDKAVLYEWLCVHPKCKNLEIRITTKQIETQIGFYKKTTISRWLRELRDDGQLILWTIPTEFDRTQTIQLRSLMYGHSEYVREDKKKKKQNKPSLMAVYLSADDNAKNAELWNFNQKKYSRLALEDLYIKFAKLLETQGKEASKEAIENAFQIFIKLIPAFYKNATPQAWSNNFMTIISQIKAGSSFKHNVDARHKEESYQLEMRITRDKVSYSEALILRGLLSEKHKQEREEASK